MIDDATFDRREIVRDACLQCCESKNRDHDAIMATRMGGVAAKDCRLLP